jgi:hypothetical protein
MGKNEPIVITKQQLLQFVKERAEKEKQLNEVEIPNQKDSVKITKRSVDDYIDGKEATLSITPVKERKKKVFKLTSSQFGQLLQTLDDNKIIKADELDI